MKDEEYIYKSDVRDKAITARSARKTRTHCGKGGRVRFPSDNLSKKELEAMNGEVKSYRMNSPMGWAEFKAMPDDLKVMYIKALRNKYGVPDAHVGNMMGVHKCSFIKEMARLNLSRGQNCGGRKKWDEEGFYSWVNGVKDTSTPVIEEEPAEDPIQEPVITSDEPEVYVEDDLPFDIVPVEEPDPIHPKLPELHIALCAELDELRKRVDELLKENEVLKAQRECDRQVIDKLRFMCSEYEENAKILEAQMDVVRLIFGGKNNG